MQAKLGTLSLHLRADLFEAATECMPNLVIGFLQDGRIIYANKAILLRLGYKQKQLKGMSIRDICPEISVDNWRLLWLDIRQNKSIQLSAKFHTQGRGLIDIDSTATYISSNARGLGFICGRDSIPATNNVQVIDNRASQLEQIITERTHQLNETKNALEKEIIKNNTVIEKYKNLSKRYKLFFNSSNDAIIVTRVYNSTVNGRIIHEVNDRACRALGYTREELIGRSTADIHPPEDWTSMLPSMGVHLIKDRHVVFESTHMTKLGKRIPVEISSHLFTLQGMRMGFSVVRDITMRKMSEQALLQSLEQEKLLRNELEESMSKRIEFTRALVHELKTPLTPLMGASGALTDRVDTEPLISLARCIRKSSESLNKRIQELLDFSKGEIGLLKLNRVSVDPVQLIQEVCEYVQPLAKSKNIKMQAAIRGNLPRIWADEERLTQILLNLTDNAFKFTPSKGSITISVETVSDQLVFKVTDTGKGMSEEKQRSLFNKDKTYAFTDKDIQSGLQLGLTLCRMLVELHGGKIQVSSRLGEGFEVMFSIPVLAPSK